MFSSRFWSFSSSKVIQACTFDSPHAGPLRNDAPAWCRSPFEPEGIVRSVLLEAYNLYISVLGLLVKFVIIFFNILNFPFTKFLIWYVYSRWSLNLSMSWFGWVLEYEKSFNVLIHTLITFKAVTHGLFCNNKVNLETFQA